MPGTRGRACSIATSFERVLDSAFHATVEVLKVLIRCDNIRSRAQILTARMITLKQHILEGFQTKSLLKIDIKQAFSAGIIYEPLYAIERPLCIVNLFSSFLFN